jgi:hypothetical protein
MRNFTLATAFAFAIAAMFVLASAKAEEMLKSGDKCWVDEHKGNNGWGGCPPEQSKRAPKASKASAVPPSRPRAAAEGGGGRY